MTYNIKKHKRDNYGIDLEDEIDHEMITSLLTIEGIKLYLYQLGKEVYGNNDYSPKNISIRYEILENGEKVDEFWHDNESDGSE